MPKFFTKFFWIVSLFIFTLLFQNCTDVDLANDLKVEQLTEGTRTLASVDEQQQEGDPVPPITPPAQDPPPPVPEPVPEPPPITPPVTPPVTPPTNPYEVQDSEPSDYLCFINGPALARRTIIYTNDLGLEGDRKGVCMSERACNELIEEDFDVRFSEESPYCTSENAHTVHLKFSEIKKALEQ